MAWDATKRETDAQQQTGEQQLAAFASDEFQYDCAVGAQGHADTDFTAAARDDVGHHAIESDGCEQRSQESEEAGERCHQAFAQQGIGDLGVESSKSLRLMAGLMAAISRLMAATWAQGPLASGSKLPFRRLASSDRTQ